MRELWQMIIRVMKATKNESTVVLSFECHRSADEFQGDSLFFNKLKNIYQQYFTLPKIEIYQKKLNLAQNVIYHTDIP